MEWIAANWEGLLAVLAALHALAVAVVNITPTPKDDAFLEKIYRVVEVFAGLFSTNASQTKKAKLNKEP